MEQSTVIIITGLPATGKTWFGRQLANRLGWPYLYKDGVKELLYDTLGWSDREWSQRLSQVSFELVFYMAEIELAARRSFIIEANFYPATANAKFLTLQQQFGFRPVQIQCVADGEVLFERFKARASDPDRHPGHIELNRLDEFEPLLRTGRAGKLELDGPYFELDTTDFNRVDYAGLIGEVERVLNEQDGQDA